MYIFTILYVWGVISITFICFFIVKNLLNLSQLLSSPVFIFAFYTCTLIFLSTFVILMAASYSKDILIKRMEADSQYHKLLSRSSEIEKEEAIKT